MRKNLCAVLLALVTKIIVSERLDGSPSAYITLTDANFDTLVSDAGQKWLIVFTAHGADQEIGKFKRKLNSFAKDMIEEIHVGILDLRANPGIAGRYGAQGRVGVSAVFVY